MTAGAEYLMLIIDNCFIDDNFMSSVRMVVSAFPGLAWLLSMLIEISVW